jgi:hypothetical protein
VCGFGSPQPVKAVCLDLARNFASHVEVVWKNRHVKFHVALAFFKMWLPIITISVAPGLALVILVSISLLRSRYLLLRLRGEAKEILKRGFVISELCFTMLSLPRFSGGKPKRQVH